MRVVKGEAMILRSKRSWKVALRPLFSQYSHLALFIALPCAIFAGQTVESTARKSASNTISQTNTKTKKIQLSAVSSRCLECIFTFVGVIDGIDMIFQIIGLFGQVSYKAHSMDLLFLSKGQNIFFLNRSMKTFRKIL